MAWIAVATVVVVAVLVWVCVRGQTARLSKLSSVQHLGEIVQLLARIKREALQHIDCPEEHAISGERLPAGAGITSLGLVLFYTIGHDGPKVAHHVSMSLQGGRLTRQMAAFFVIYLHGTLQVGGAPIELTVSPSAYHLVLVLDENAHAEFSSLPVATPAGPELQDIAGVCWARSREVQFERVL